MYPAAESVTRDTRTKHASPHKSFTVSAFERTLLPSAQDKKNWLHCSGTWTYLFMDSSRLIHRKGEFSSSLMSEYASNLDSMFCNASLTSRVSLTILPVKWDSGRKSMCTAKFQYTELGFSIPSSPHSSCHLGNFLFLSGPMVSMSDFRPGQCTGHTRSYVLFRNQKQYKTYQGNSPKGLVNCETEMELNIIGT